MFFRFHYGTNTEILRDILTYWKDEFDWRKIEGAINNVLPQYKTQIDGLDIHFAHVKPNPQVAKGKKVIPLLIAHGWPGSFFEFTRSAAQLSRATEFAFELVIPSIPGFAFSDAPSKQGLTVPHIARIYKVRNIFYIMILNI